MISQASFGRTGHLSTRTIFGAAALGSVTQEEADRTLDVLLAHGVNHIDTAASYGDAEQRIGPWMKKHRSAFFLATKTGQRTAEKAREDLHRSLERMRVDRVDLIQLHCLVEPTEWEVAMGPSGALEALVEARSQGLVRFIGVTGHGVNAPAMHRRSLQRFDFDTVLFPYNYMMMQNPAYAADVKALLRLCRRRNVGVQTIKSIARGPYGDTARTHATWYAPLKDRKTVDRAVHWVLSNPTVFLNTVGDIHLLPLVLDAASRFRRKPAATVMDKMAGTETLAPLFVYRQTRPRL
ncbi:MAG: aldo/keto reductase [candidate division Zixibacteria bacterium]|nr:aldo/keto reductase [candidate division Zixibacteria bacterium]